MSGRAHRPVIRFHNEREPTLLLLWNGGQPFLIDGRFKHLVIESVKSEYWNKKFLLEWASKNHCRCVGFDGDARPRLRSFQRRENTWAVV